MVIREASGKDAASIKALVQQLGYEVDSSIIEKNIAIYEKTNGHVLVAEDEKGIIGFISGAYLPLFHSLGLMLRITAMCVDESRRSKGVGRTLVTAVEEQCRANNSFYIEVTSGAQRKDEAHLFYIKLGYRIYEGKRFLKTIEQ